MEIKYGTRFRKQYLRADKAIKTAFAQTLEIFLEEPNHPSLRNHVLKKKYSGYQSIDVTGDWRAIFKESQRGKQKTIVFHMLGNHRDLYK
jgi:mRNA-degrading endonuclease YafQ of YafQ-DinJ toxin-antitoxin module